jgi:hypothetical protein
MRGRRPYHLSPAGCAHGSGAILAAALEAASKTTTGAKKPPIKVHVLKCRSDSCNALLAFEETEEGYLLGQVLELADVDDGKRFFPCPKCGGHNLVEEVDVAGKKRVRVHGFEPPVP